MVKTFIRLVHIPRHEESHSSEVPETFDFERHLETYESKDGDFYGWEEEIPYEERMLDICLKAVGWDSVKEIIIQPFKSDMIPIGLNRVLNHVSFDLVAHDPNIKSEKFSVVWEKIYKDDSFSVLETLARRLV